MERSLEQPVANPTYLDFFGLTRPPFGRLTSPTHLFQTEQYALLMEHLVNATTHADSLLVICGADGSGKTTLIDRYVSSLDDNVIFVVVDETCHGDVQFFSTFLTQIGFEDISGTASELRNITKEFLVCRGIAGDHVLLIIDNAHSTDPMILEQLRWLSEIKIKDRRVISVVLAGNADLVHVVNAPAMSGIKFENQVVFHIRSYSRNETASYVWHSLRLAGGSDGVKLASEAKLLIHRYSGGIPQQINRLCDDMLAEACRLETRVISERVVRTVADKKGLLPHVVPLHGRGRRKTDPDYQRVKRVPKTGDTTAGGAAKISEAIEGFAPATADVGPEQLLKYVSKLSVQIEDLRADKVRALQDIDARNNDIIELRKRFSAQAKEIEELTRSLAADAEEITRQDRLLSSNATALQASENRSRKLAAELEEEVRAKEAAQHELAEATAAVAELNQLKQELQAALGDLQADLEAGIKVVDERALDIEALEKNAVKLKDELESKTGELAALREELKSLRDSLAARDTDVAELDARLEASQDECELLRRRASAATVDEDDVAKEAVTVPPRGARAYPSQVVAKFEKTLSSISVYQTLKKHDPDFYDDLIDTYKQLVGQDLSDKQVNDALRAKQAKLIEKLLPGTSDDAIVAYARLIVDQLDELRRDCTEPCLTLLIPPAGPENASPVYSEMTRGRELDILDTALRTYDADRPIPKEKDVWPELGPIFDGLFAEFSADDVAAMENSYDPGIDRALVCKVTRALYSGVLDLPKRNAANALRWLLST